MKWTLDEGIDRRPLLRDWRKPVKQGSVPLLSHTGSSVNPVLVGAVVTCLLFEYYRDPRGYT